MQLHPRAKSKSENPSDGDKAEAMIARAEDQAPLDRHQRLKVAIAETWSELTFGASLRRNLKPSGNIPRRP